MSGKGMSTIGSLGIIGGGAWGTALALTASRAGRQAILWARDAAIVEAINLRAENPRYLPGSRLSPSIAATAELGEALSADAVLLAVPAQQVGALARQLAPLIRPAQPILIAAKGIDRESGKRLSEVLIDAIPQARTAVLSGPSFASDVANGLPTAVTIAALDEALALELCRALAGPAFRPYAETDVIGVELGGALKNVLAIAAGAVIGRGLGASAAAAIIARGFAEQRRFAQAQGARPETLMGLSGLGDLVLTCSNRQSRNYSFGIALGEGRPAATGILVEGAATAAIVVEIAEKLALEMPVCQAVADVLARRLSIGEAMEDLMTRPLKRETI